MTISHNPFKQTAVTYCLEMKTRYAMLESFIQVCEKFSTNIVYFETEGSRSVESLPEDLWQISAYLENKPNLQEIKKLIAEVALSQKTPTPDISLSRVEDKDWVSEVQKNFKPINAGRFFIHATTHKEEIPNDKIIIQMDAGRAFGTGEHETTSNCLKSLSAIADGPFTKCLDMGCGSGILAIAMAKLWPDKTIIATDIDEQAVLVTEENYKLNDVSSIIVKQSNGYNSNFITSNGPYQIITSNILATPLIDMASKAYKYLDKGGLIFLAGFIKTQVADVLNAHLKQGFILEEEVTAENWPVLIMRKPISPLNFSDNTESNVSSGLADYDSHLNSVINPWG